MLAGFPNPDVRPLALFPWRSAMTRSLLSSFLSWTGLLCALAPAAAQTTTPAATIPAATTPALAALTGVVGDPRPDAPALSPRGSYAVGVRTLSLLNPGQLDVLQTPKDGALPRADRRLTVEVWYPAPGARGSGTVNYADTLGSGPGDPKRPNTPFLIRGRATRAAPPLAEAQRPAGGFPLVIVSHGYPGSRFLMSYLCENLASKGYVVAAINHTGSTHLDKAAFASTLLNRPLDDNFVLSELAQRSAAGSGSFLSGLVNPERTGLIGYSMGGYGALNAVGAGFADQVLGFVPAGALRSRQLGQFKVDPRIQAVVAFAPWGGDAAVRGIGVNTGAQFGFWDAAGLAAIRVPTLFVVGDKDDVSGFEGGVKALFENTVNAERYLLVYQNARHNSAPNPPPAESLSNFEDYMHYAEPAWDMTRLNDLNMHFVTAFLDLKLKGLTDRAQYLDVKVPVAQNGMFSRNPDGTLKPDDTSWPGFAPRTAVGIELYKLPPR